MANLAALKQAIWEFERDLGDPVRKGVPGVEFEISAKNLASQAKSILEELTMNHVVLRGKPPVLRGKMSVGKRVKPKKKRSHK